MAMSVPKADKVTVALLGVACVVLAILLTSQAARAETHRKSAYPTVQITGELSLADVQRAVKTNGVIRVSGSPGGVGAAAMELARAPNVVIDGTCNSACAWAFITNERACFTHKASFGFHGAHDPGTGGQMTAATDYWLNQVRGSLRGRLEPLRRSSKLITLNAAQMMQYYGDRACGPSGGRSRIAMGSRT
jgi:hypothetical protein